jgi:UDP-2,3-diacylglucosamine pyrophosphatase LpxH
MLLREFFYFNDDKNTFANDRRYDNAKDSSVLKKTDTRKLRLTLRQINQLRQQSEAHESEEKSELEFIRQMYGTPVEAQQPAE